MMDSGQRSLISRCADGGASDKDWKELSTLLSENPEAFEAYCTHSEICSSLEWVFGSEIDLSEILRRQAKIVNETRLREHRRTRLIALATAAAITIVSLTYASFRILDARPGATLRANAVAAWNISNAEGVAGDTGATLRKGDRLRLSRGAVEITLGTGVKGIIEAPADIRLLGKNRLEMREGHAHFDAPGEAAKGFTVVSEGFEVVDLGTRFGISLIDGLPGEVHLFEGKVQVTALVDGTRRKTYLLRPGKGVGKFLFCLGTCAASRAAKESLRGSFPPASMRCASVSMASPMMAASLPGVAEREFQQRWKVPEKMED